MTTWQWNDDVAAELTRRFRHWTDCNTVGDVATLRQYLHPDFLYVSVYGRRYDRAGYLALVESLQPGSAYVVHRSSARVLGDVAQLDGEYYTHSATTLGEDLSAHTRFTATWVREEGNWVCLTQQGSFYEADCQTRDAVAGMLAERIASGRSVAPRARP